MPEHVEIKDMQTPTCCSDTGGVIDFDKDDIIFSASPHQCGAVIRTVEQATELMMNLSAWIMQRKAAENGKDQGEPQPGD